MQRSALRSTLLIACACLAPVAVAKAGAAPLSAAEQAEFKAFLDKVRQAHAEYIQSRPQAFKDLWSRAPDVTIFGGFGSGEQGWEQVGPRLDWASSQFSEGSRTNEPITSYVDGNLGYLVQLERVRFKVPGRSEESRLDLRVTMIFRREPVGWRIIHRHADSQMTRQGPRSGEGLTNNELQRTTSAQATEPRR
jgi:ketosteroid isomerase-like protein